MLRILALIALSPSFLVAQPPPSTQKDTLGIRQAVLNYVEGFYNADVQRMREAIHPELAKRLIVHDDAGNMMLQNMGSTHLLYNTKRNQNTNVMNPDQPLKTDLIIYDIFGNVATAKVTTNKFKLIDYLHLGKLDGEWRIINVLWERTEQ